MASPTRARRPQTADLPMLRRGTAIGGGFAAQGLGYAAIMTALPSFESRWGIDETAVALIILGTCLAAAVGSILADRLAVVYGSRLTMVAALCVQSVTILTIAFAPVFAVFLIGIVAYGIGLGLMDASQNMQGVIAERTLARPMMGRFYASYTAASIVGALCMSAFLASLGAVTGALIVAAAVDVIVAIVGWRWLDRTRAAHQAHDVPADRPKLPAGPIVAVGLIVLAAYTLDSAVSTWSTTYLEGGLGVAAAVAPLGYAAYQGAILVARLATDPLEARVGRSRLALVALLIGVLGCAVVAFVPAAAGAIIGFAVAGLATGALVPLAFSAAGALLPARSDEIIARVNLFNYGGAVAGAVVLGLVASGPSLGVAFLIPGIALLAFAPLLGVLKRRTASAATDGSAA